MKNLLLITASLAPKYAGIIKVFCLLALALFVEFILRENFVLCEIDVSGFLALSAIFLFFLSLDKAFYALRSRILLVAYTALCLVLSLYIDIFSTFAFLGIIIICIAHRHSSPSLAIMWALPLFTFLITFVFESFLAFIHHIKNFNAKSPNLNTSKIFPYFLLPAFLSLIFLSIFATGYAEFNIVLENIFALNSNIFISLINIDLFAFIIIFLFLVALHTSRISSKTLIRKDISFELNETLEKSFIICLVCFNLIFLSLNLINLKDFIFQNNFYNLARDALNACHAMILGAFFAGFCTLIFFLAKNQNAKMQMLLKAWLIQNLIIMLTALIKLLVYIMEFSLTVPRLNGLFLIFFLAICTTLALRKMYSDMSIKALNNYIVYLALAFSTLYICIDKEDFITSYNLRCSKKPDFAYLRSLSPHSLVAIHKYIKEGNTAPIDLKNQVDFQLEHLNVETLRDKILRKRLIAIQNDLNAASSL